MRVVLLGKNGQVGRELARTLLPHGTLITLGREDIDLSRPETVRKTLMTQEPQIIVNAGAYTAVDRAEEQESLAQAVNAEAVSELAAVARHTGALLVHYSTDYVFDGSKQDAYRPNDTPNPQNVYGRSKLNGERAIQCSGCNHLIFRTSWVYSSYGHNFIKTVLRLATECDDLKVVVDQIGAPTSAELLADVTSLAIAGHRQGHLAAGIYHLTADGATSWYGLACRVIDRAVANGRMLKLRGKDIQAISTADFPTPATRPANSLMDSNDLEQALSLEFPDWSLHVDRMVDQITKENAFG